MYLERFGMFWDVTLIPQGFTGEKVAEDLANYERVKDMFRYKVMGKDGVERVVKQDSSCRKNLFERAKLTDCLPMYTTVMPSANQILHGSVGGLISHMELENTDATTADPVLGCYAFEYEPAWKRRDTELAPLTVPLSDRHQTFTFPALPKPTHFGLPSMLADALPDDFGNALIDAWMATKGIEKSAITVLDRLAYMGKRAMGALEFRPARGSHIESSAPIEMKQLVEEARRLVQGSFAVDHEAKAAPANIIKVGTSAGGARAKAVIAWNPQTDEVFDTAPGFQHWLLKFDGVGRDKELGTGEGYGRIEYAYHLMAKEAGVIMSPCRLLEENGRAHFMTKRFDREDIRGKAHKHHLQTLCAMNHLDFRQRGTHAYEQLFMTIGKLGLDDEAKGQTFRRMAFNGMARNCDDHTKNFAFLLKQAHS
jgi:serine/threonine-protein kinase HipA